MMIHGHCEAFTSDLTLDVASQHSGPVNHAKQHSKGVQFMGSMEDFEGRVSQIRGKDVGGKLLCEILDLEGLDAAYALFEMANGHLHWPNNELPSCRRKHVLDSDDIRQHADAFGGDGKMKTTGKRLQFPSLEANNSERNSRKRKHEDEKLTSWNASLGGGKFINPAVSEREEVDDVVPLMKSAKKQLTSWVNPYIHIHTEISFSIIHFLSAVRSALITPRYEDEYALVSGKHRLNENREQRHNSEGYEKGGMYAEQMRQNNVPSLTIHEVVQRVRLRPGDHCILDTMEPLQELVRGVLKIFSSTTPPAGAMIWNALAIYEKTSKTWSWIGPIKFSSTQDDHMDIQISPEAWDIPRLTLVKLVDSFAKWLKNDQEMLQKIGSLPAPPMILMEPINREERFSDLRALSRVSTISPSCDEVRAYFHREEALRYSIPERAFSYTAIDGKKSAVAPLRRCSGKPLIKARDHIMLKHNRPPQFTMLCLVRDAAARLPGRVGTRADICTLARDSQFIIEGISDLQINQVVSGALDRLHYERDPCVRFDRERHLWVYLHAEREDEDFEFDCTSSRKRGKRIIEETQQGN